MMKTTSVWIGKERFDACFEDDRAPQTCAAWRSRLPLRSRLIHARWSGEACWAPLGAIDSDLSPENVVSDPRPGEILYYPGGISEAELLVAYGTVRFASVAGPLAGNPLLLITEKLDALAAIGRDILWGGALEMVIEQAQTREG